MTEKLLTGTLSLNTTNQRIQDGKVAKLADVLYCGGNTLDELLSNWKRVLDALQNIKSEMRSLKSNENIHKKESGSYDVVSANKASSVTL